VIGIGARGVPPGVAALAAFAGFLFFAAPVCGVDLDGATFVVLAIDFAPSTVRG
jgi:hypothetical protein